MTKGVSVVICCYNSAKLLPDTLKHISRLSIPGNIPFEVIIVDNNSTDNTAEVAEKFFSHNEHELYFKIVKQKIQGLSSARKMGFDNAKYEYVIFCDDDNRLDKDYAEISFRVMQQNEKIGAMGGESEAVTGGTFPVWFEKFKQSYSVGKQYEKSGYVTWNNSALWGAGMVVRKSALENLFSEGFESLLSDRNKSTLTSGGDIELCYVLRLAGWELWYEPALKIKHYITQQRLTWKYLRKLNRGFGAQKVYFDPYLKVFDTEKESFKQGWQYQTLTLLKKIRGYGIRKLINFKHTMEGDPEILRIEKTVGRLSELIKIRGDYTAKMNSVRNAKWRKVFSIDNSQKI